jgi:hypothetical protein
MHVRNLIFVIFIFACSDCEEPVIETIQPCKTPLIMGSAFEHKIQWKSALDSARKNTSNAWCRGVGPPLIYTVAKPAKQINVLIIAAWNTHVGSGDIDMFITDLKAGKFSDGKPVFEFVLLLQEVVRAGPEVPGSISKDTKYGKTYRFLPPSGNRTNLIKVAKQHGLSLYYAPAIRNGGIQAFDPPEDRGNAILSTLPLSMLSVLELPHERQRRIAIGARVSGQTTANARWYLKVVSVHLENRAEWYQWYKSFGISRLCQVKALIKTYWDNGVCKS